RSARRRCRSASMATASGSHPRSSTTCATSRRCSTRFPETLRGLGGAPVLETAFPSSDAPLGRCHRLTYFRQKQSLVLGGRSDVLRHGPGVLRGRARVLRGRARVFRRGPKVLGREAFRLGSQTLDLRRG